MQNERYSEKFGISQSMCKSFRFKSPKKWKTLHIDKQVDIDKDEDSFTLGSLIDTILFTPGELNDRFLIGQDEFKSKPIRWILSRVYDRVCSENLQIVSLNDDMPVEQEPLPFDLEHEVVRGFILEYANLYKAKPNDPDEEPGWNTGWKEQTRINKIIEKGTDYFNLLIKAKGRKIVSSAMNLEAVGLKEILHKDSQIREYFVETPDSTLIFQLEIFVDYMLNNGYIIPLKGALDIVRFDHINSTIRVVDFKSSYSAFDFLKSIKQFGYCDQLSYYDQLLRLWLRDYENGKYNHYQILEPWNIVIDIQDKVPYVYEYDWRDLAIAREGNCDMLFELNQTHDHPHKIKTGWMQILSDIGWHMQNQMWDKPRELYECGKIRVNLLNN